jgi:hypothetical protein
MGNLWKIYGKSMKIYGKYCFHKWGDTPKWMVYDGKSMENPGKSY